jgi:vacuolar-type H+-ATPase subunit E/Vma4
MTQDLQGLIEKIQREGLKAAQEKAQKIEADAREAAGKIIAQAQAQARELVAAAKTEISREHASSRQLLSQAARDVILQLREKILLLLGNLVEHRVREALSSRELAEIIQHLVKNYSKKDDGEVVVYLKHDDLEKLKKDLLAHLEQEAKKGLSLRASDEITGGFIISYDAGKSHFDFTDKALAEYILHSLKPKLGEALKEIL